jgi:hypothetical protein
MFACMNEHMYVYIGMCLCVRERGEMHTGFGRGDLRERDHLEDLGVDERIILKWICKKWDDETLTGMIRLGARGGPLYMQ